MLSDLFRICWLLLTCWRARCAGGGEEEDPDLNAEFYTCYNTAAIFCVDATVVPLSAAQLQAAGAATCETPHINHIPLPNDSHPLSAGMETSMFEPIKHTFWQLWGEERWLPFWSALINAHARLWGAVNDDRMRFCWQISAKKMNILCKTYNHHKQPNSHSRLTEINNSFWKVWRNSIHFGGSATFVLFRLNAQPRLLRWTQMEVYIFLHLFPDKSHPLREYDSALNVLPEILMSGPVARFHCSKCWYAFLWQRCLCSPGCFPAGRTINSFEGPSELKQMDIYH